jgi:hypothetical protein
VPEEHTARKLDKEKIFYNNFCQLLLFSHQ